jgi:hypothetical protein
MATRYEPWTEADLAVVASYLADVAPDSAAARDTAAMVAMFRSRELQAVWQAAEDHAAGDAHDWQVREIASMYEPLSAPRYPDRSTEEG